MPHVLDQGTCRSCNAPIVWAVTAAGKRMPLDAKPQKLVVIDEGLPIPVAVVRDCYTSHFATCPNATQHRSHR